MNSEPYNQLKANFLAIRITSFRETIFLKRGYFRGCIQIRVPFTIVDREGQGMIKE